MHSKEYLALETKLFLFFDFHVTLTEPYGRISFTHTSYSSTSGQILLYQCPKPWTKKKQTQHHVYRGLGCMAYVQWGQTDIDQDGNEHLGQSAERPNGAQRQAHLSILSCLWPNVHKTAVRGRLVFRPGWQVIAQLDMWNRRVCWRVQRLQARYSSNEMYSFYGSHVFIIQASVKHDKFDKLKWLFVFCIMWPLFSFAKKQPGTRSAWKLGQYREKGLCYLNGIILICYWTNKTFLMQH